MSTKDNLINGKVGQPPITKVGEVHKTRYGKSRIAEAERRAAIKSHMKASTSSPTAAQRAQDTRAIRSPNRRGPGTRVEIHEDGSKYRSSTGRRKGELHPSRRQGDIPGENNNRLRPPRPDPNRVYKPPAGTKPMAPANPNLPKYNPGGPTPSYQAPKYHPTVTLEKVPYNPSPGLGGRINPGDTIRIEGLAQKPAPGSSINKEAIKASIKATEAAARNSVRSNAGLFSRGRQALNSGVTKLGQAAMNTLPGRGVARIAGAVGKTAAGKVAGAVLSKTAVPLMVAGAAWDVGRTVYEGVGAYNAGQHQKRTEAHTKEKYGSIDAATRTRHANDLKRARQAIANNANLKQGYKLP